MEADIEIKTFSNGCKLVCSTLEHAIRLAPHLRPYDILECRATGFEPIDALLYALENDNETYTVVLPDGTPIAMFGIGRPIGKAEAYIWLLGSDKVQSVGLQFLRECRAIVQWMVEPYGYASNYVYAGYDTSVRWLKWMGATFTELRELCGVPFYKFTLTAL